MVVNFEGNVVRLDDIVEIKGFDRDGIFVGSASRSLFGPWKLTVGALSDELETRDEVIHALTESGAWTIKYSDGVTPSFSSRG